MKKFRNLRPEEIDARISQIDAGWCTLLLYKDARCDMNILDETVGSLNWKREHTRDNANCIVSIYDDEKKEWVSKEDTGTESFSEAEKGLASDSFKRACVNWGIGRELYSSPTIFITARKDMVKNGRDGEFYKNDKGKYETKTRFSVEVIDYDENENIKDLIIRDNKQHIRFCQLTKEKEKELLKISKELKEMIEEVEKADKTFDRKKLYETYGVETDNDLLFKQQSEAIDILKKKLEKIEGGKK